MPVHLRRSHDLTKTERESWVPRCIKKWLLARPDLNVEYICHSFAQIHVSDGLELLRRWSSMWYEYAITYRTKKQMTKMKQPEKIYEFPDNIFPFELRRVQQEAKDFFETIEMKNLLVVAETGIGKTEIGEMAAKRAIDQGYRCLWLTSLKADTEEKITKFTGRGYRVLIDTGDHRTDLDKYTKTDPDIIIATNERAYSILKSERKRSVVFEGDPLGEEDAREVDVVVIDEIHNFGTQGRGPTLESFIITLRELYPQVTIVALSATIAEPESVAKWLDAHLIKSTEDERPVPLTKRIEIYKDMFRYDENMMLKIDTMERIFAKHPDSQFLIFCSSRRRPRDLFSYYTGYKDRKTPKVSYMREKGYGFHHGGLGLKTKNDIVEAFLDGDIKYLFCTSTLIQSINLPVDVVIAFDTHFYSYLQANSFLIDHNTFNQLGGRAGRPGMSEHGYFYAITTEENLGSIIVRMDENMIPKSYIYTCLTDKILSWLVSGTAEDIDTLMHMVSRIYNFQIDTGDEGYIDVEMVRADLAWLERHEFVEVLDEAIVPTEKGKLTSRLMISPLTAQHFFDMAELVRYHNKPEHIFAILMNTEEFLQNVNVQYAKDRYCLDVGRKWLQLVKCRECDTILNLREKPVCPHCGNDDTYKFLVHMFDDRMLKAFAMVFREEIEKDVEQYKRRIKLSPTDLNNLKSETNRLLSACCILLKDHPEIDMINTVALLANAGILDMRIIELLKVDGIGMTYATRLVNAGILTVSNFITTDLKYLTKVLRKKEGVVNKLIKNATDFYKNS